jgi:hypothetical protein
VSVYEFQGSPAASTFVCIKAGVTLPVKIIQVAILAFSGAVTISLYTGGGTITGGSTPTPVPLRSNAPAALSTVRVGATAISGTANTLQVGSTTYSPPQSLILGAGAVTVLAISSTATLNAAIYFDELEIQPGY